jgi:hypothetical protein
VAEQLDETAAPLDAQEDESDILLAQPLVRYDAAISASDWTAETLIGQLKKGNIFLDPAFQRRDAWDVRRKSQYIESLIIGIPTPQIILAERKEQRGSYIVIDGKQRLLSLRQFSADASDKSFEQFKLKGLEIRDDLNGLAYQDMTEDLFGVLTSDFENATIRTIVIKSWPTEEFLYEVFLRINSGSVQLSPQELRQALHPGPFTTALNEYVIQSQALKSILNLTKPDFRMRDNEIALRYIAFRNFLGSYNGSMKSILDYTTFVINEQWVENETKITLQFQDLDWIIKTTQAIFGERDAFRKWNGEAFEARINRAVFDVISFYFTDRAVAEAALVAGDAVVAAFKQLCVEDAEFLTSITSTTKSVWAVEYRLVRWSQALGEAIGRPLPQPTLG